MRFRGDQRGNAGVFFVLGAGALLTASSLTLDLVRYVHLQERAERAAVTIADYASRTEEVDCRETRALARFLHAESLGDQSYGLLTLTTVTGDSGEPGGFVEDWTWNPPFGLGPAADPARLEQCRGGLAASRTETLTALAMTDGEGVVMAQLCLAPNPDAFLVPGWIQDAVGMQIYRYHLLPIRAAQLSEVCT